MNIKISLRFLYFFNTWYNFVWYILYKMSICTGSISCTEVVVLDNICIEVIEYAE